MHCIWSAKTIQTAVKICLDNTIIIPTVTYASETWKDTASIHHKFYIFHQLCLCIILHVSYGGHVTNDEIKSRANSLRPWDIVAERRMHLAEHLLCCTNDHHPKTAVQWMPLDGMWRWWRPKIIWWSTLKKDLQHVGIRWQEAEKTAGDRVRWGKLAVQCV